MSGRSILTPAVCLCLLVASSATVTAGPNKKEAKARKRAALKAKAERARKAKQVDHWVRTLTRPDPMDRFHAAWNLEALAPDSVPALIRTLNERKVKTDVLSGVTEVLGWVAAREAIPALKQVVLDPTLDDGLRLRALFAIARMLAPESRAFLREVASGDLAKLIQQRPQRRARRTVKKRRQSPVDVTAVMRRTALIALGMIGDHAVRPAIESAVKVSDAETRRAAYRTIGYLKDRRLIPQCVKGLRDRHPLVRAQAGNALGKIGDPKTADVIQKAIRKLRNGPERFLLVDALAWMGRQGAIRELMAYAGNPKSPVQSSAATILYEIEEKQAVPLFRRLLAESLRGKHQPGVDQITAFSLGAMQDAQAVPVLIKALTRSRLAVQREAAASLGRLRAQAAVKPLLKIIQKGDRSLRVNGLVALGKIKAPQAASYLRAALRDRDPSVRWGAVVALERFGSKRSLKQLKPLTRDAHPFVAKAAREALVVLGGQPRPPLTDVRGAVSLLRLRALEREYLLRLDLGGLWGLLTSRAAPPREVVTQEAEYGTEIVGWESYFSTCGGTHPPIEYRRPIYETIKEQITEINPEWVRHQREQAAARDLQRRYREQTEEIYRRQELKAEVRELLQPKDAAGPKARPQAPPQKRQP